MAAVKYNYSMIRGDSTSIRITCDPAFQTGDEIAMMVREDADSEAVISKTVTEFQDGAAVIGFLPEDTRELSAGDYVYDIQVTWASGNVQTIVQMSRFRIMEDVTHAVTDFSEAVKRKNMLDRAIGFVCKSTAGRVVKLIQSYDSNIFTAEPEELPAQWGFVWSHDPKKARPFIALSTSPYNTGDCCTEDGGIFRSKMDGNVFAPSAYPQGWEAVLLWLVS